MSGRAGPILKGFLDYQRVSAASTGCVSPWSSASLLLPSPQHLTGSAGHMCTQPSIHSLIRALNHPPLHPPTDSVLHPLVHQLYRVSIQILCQASGRLPSNEQSEKGPGHYSVVKSVLPLISSSLPSSESRICLTWSPLDKVWVF